MSAYTGDDDPSWTDHAACRGMDAVFFSFEAEAVAGAKATCRLCPVLSRCLEDALATESADYRNHAGVRAGRTPLELVKLRRSRPPVAKPIRHGTLSGYRMHRRRDEQACDPCLAALREQSRLNAARNSHRWAASS
jgi:hypothetical protein